MESIDVSYLKTKVLLDINKPLLEMACCGSKGFLG